MDKKIKVTLVRSPYSCDKKQQAVVYALGLHKIRQVKEHTANPCIMGMIAKVSHLVKVEEV